jgi:hypothetical protein
MDISEDKENVNDHKMEFVRRTVMSQSVQDVIGKMDLTGQSLLVAADNNDCHNIQPWLARALKSTMAWGTGQIERVSQRCEWPVSCLMKYQEGFEKSLRPLPKDRDNAWPPIWQHHGSLSAEYNCRGIMKSLRGQHPGLATA